jgi:hypothetical protein
MLHISDTFLDSEFLSTIDMKRFQVIMNKLGPDIQFCLRYLPFVFYPKNVPLTSLCQ